MSVKGGAPLMILIVEDNPEMASVFRKGIEGMGRRVVVAPTGEAALDALAADPCELALVDLVLAGSSLNGLQFAVQARMAGYDVPMIAITGAKGLVPEEGIVPDPFGAVIGKPLLITELRALVDQHARQPLVE